MGSGAFIANNPMSSEGPETDQGDEDGLLTQPSTNEDPFDRLKLQEPYDVLDSSNRWCEGEVVTNDYEILFTILTNLFIGSMSR